MEIHLTNKTPLAIVDIALTSSLADGWEETATAMHEGKNGFELPGHLDYYIANSTLHKKYRGVTRLAYMLSMARKKLENIYNAPIPTLLALPEPTREGLQGEKLAGLLIEKIKSLPGFEASFSAGDFGIDTQSRCSLAFQLNRAREILDTTSYNQVMIMSVDCFLAPQTLTALEAAPLSICRRSDEEYKVRLVRTGINTKNSDGFVPSEGAGILVVEKAETSTSPYLIDGLGFGFEPATLTSKNINKGDGLATAITQACEGANVPFADYAWCIASISGEAYFTKEASIAQTRCLDNKTDNKPLWTPASYIGETGCLVGIAMVAMAMASFNKNYALGKRSMCYMSNDDEQRAAFSFSYRDIRNKELNK